MLREGAWRGSRPGHRGGAARYSVGPKYNAAWDAFDRVELGASLARARTELQLAADGPHTPACVCDDSGKFNRSVETVASARRP